MKTRFFWNSVIVASSNPPGTSIIDLSSLRSLVKFLGSTPSFPHNLCSNPPNGDLIANLDPKLYLIND